MSDHHNTLSAAVVALVAVAGLVLFYANGSTGAAQYSAGSGLYAEESFVLGLEAGMECVDEGALTMHRDEWRVCCANKCNSDTKCAGKTYKVGFSTVNDCSPNCNNGCREQIRRDTLILPKTKQA